MKYNEDLKIDKHIIDKIVIGLAETIPQHIIRNGEISMLEDFLTRSFQYRFKSYLAGKEYRYEITDKIIEIPINSWEHLKEEYAPKWFLNHFPVKYEKIDIRKTIHISKICPHIELPNDDRKHIEFLFYNNEKR